jgi:adenylosuccinate synthase
VADTVLILNNYQNTADVILESTQGFGLSLHASGYYPFCTSADLTPGQILNDCGLSSRLDHRVLMVMRTYPIRVGGNSGPLYSEKSWEEMEAITNGYIKRPERTTVTKIPRRIGGWDSSLAKRAVRVCRPDAIALTFLDYVFPELNGKLALSPQAERFIGSVERSTGVPITMVSVGFQDIIERVKADDRIFVGRDRSTV